MDCLCEVISTPLPRSSKPVLHFAASPCRQRELYMNLLICVLFCRLCPVRPAQSCMYHTTPQYVCIMPCLPRIVQSHHTCVRAIQQKPTNHPAGWPLPLLVAPPSSPPQHPPESPSSCLSPAAWASPRHASPVCYRGRVAPWAAPRCCSSPSSSLLPRMVSALRLSFADVSCALYFPLALSWCRLPELASPLSFRLSLPTPAWLVGRYTRTKTSGCVVDIQGEAGLWAVRPGSRTCNLAYTKTHTCHIAESKAITKRERLASPTRRLLQTYPWSSLFCVVLARNLS